MKRWFSLSLLLAALLCITTSSLLAQKKIPSSEELLDFNGSQGTEFFIAIPPNELNPFPTDALDIYIASAYDTEVELLDYSGQKKTTFKIKANTIEVVSTSDGRLNWSMELQGISEQVVNQALRLRSKRPISVYVLNSKLTTSDGFLAIPTSSWGKEYIVTTYYDFREGKPWAGGFAVIAKSDNTEIKINLRGKGELDGRTMQGKRINTGQIETIVLQEGDVYQVKGDGTTRGVFDLTGTLVTSNKPVGLISFHERTTMPNQLQFGNGRNHLVEMTPPVDTWGKKYVSVNYLRENKNPGGGGDVFRVVAAEANTRWKMDYYDRTTKQRLGGSGGVLGTAGESADIAQSPGPLLLTTGFSVWTADKPIFVMQYSCSSTWDGDPILDPFMINVVPEEQFITSTIFQQPPTAKFPKNRLNLIVSADTADPQYINNLKSLEIDGVPVWNHPGGVGSSLLYNHMGNNLHWVTVEFDFSPSSRRINGNGKVKFGGYIYGFGNFDAYGWPAAAGFKKTGFVDTLPPVLVSTDECGDYTYIATEYRNIPDPPRNPPVGDSDQVETGIAIIDTVTCQNYVLEYITNEGEFPQDPSLKKYEFRWKVSDKSQDAMCIFYVSDYANNRTYDTIYYYADKLAFSPNPLHYGKLRLGTKKSLSVTVTNNSPGEVQLRETKLQIGSFYTVTAGLPAPAKLAPGASHTFTIEYDGREETTDITKDFDIDTLEVKTFCGLFKIPIDGVAAVPRIIVEDWNAGLKNVNEETCKSGGLRIENPGSDTLRITRINLPAGTDFTFSNPTTPGLPIVLLPKQSVQLVTVCYKSPNLGKDSTSAIFENNGEGPDSIAVLEGAAQEAGPAISSYNWGAKRVNTLHQAFIHVWNSGTKVLTLNDVAFKTGGKYFPAGSDETNYDLKIVGMYSNGVPSPPKDLNGDGQLASDSADILVMFRPGAEASYFAEVVPVWATSDSPINEVIGTLEGSGILPKITINGETLACGDTPTGKDTTMYLTIVSSGTMPLTITSIDFAAGTNLTEWRFGPGFPPMPIVVSNIAGSNLVRLPIIFQRQSASGSVANVSVVSDAARGTGVDSSTFVPATSTTAFTVGSCSGPEIVVTDANFPRTLANCNSILGSFTITNSGGGFNRLQVNSITPSGADATNFVIQNIVDENSNSIPWPLTAPLFISSGNSARVNVRFSPTEPNAPPFADRAYSAQFVADAVEENTGTPITLTDNTATVTGTGFVIPFTFSLTNDLPANGSREPGKAMQFTVSGTSADWASAVLTNFTVDVLYPTQTLSYRTGSVRSLVNGLTVADPTIITVNPTNSILRFTVTANPAVQANGNLFEFTTTLLLNSLLSSKQDLAVDLGRQCLLAETFGDSLKLENCALTQRVVGISATQFLMSPIHPNPSTNGSAVLNFGVGINAPTTIELVNAQGQVVRTFVNSMLTSGEYTLSFETSSLSNGVYMLRMRSADYSASTNLVIAD